MSTTEAPVPSLVLLHGVGLDHRMWQRCTERLAQHYRVLTPDLPGHGSAESTGPRTSLAELAELVASRLPQRAHVVGFSLGALIAQQLALVMPERIASLSLVSSVANRSAEQAAAVAERKHSAEADFDATARAAVDRWMSPEWQAGEPELATELRTTMLGNDKASYLACYRVFATADAQLWPQLPAITAPTLCMTGEDDPGSTPAMTRELASALPNTRTSIVPGARHLLPLEHPEALTAAILEHTKEADHDHTTQQTL